MPLTQPRQGLSTESSTTRTTSVLRNIEEGIAGIETATQLVEKAGDDIKVLTKKVKSFG